MEYSKFETYFGFDDSKWSTQINVNDNCNNDNDGNPSSLLDCLQLLSKITIKHQSNLKDAFGKKTHYQILDGHSKDVILQGEQKNGWTHRKPVTILDLNNAPVLKIEFEQSNGIFKSLVPPKRVLISLADGTRLGSVETKTRWSKMFEIYSDDGVIQFVVNSKEKVFKPSEYPIITACDGKLIGRIYRSGFTGTHFSIETMDTLSPTIKALLIGLVMLLDCIVREGNNSANAAI